LLPMAGLKNFFPFPTVHMSEFQTLFFLPSFLPPFSSSTCCAHRVSAARTTAFSHTTPAMVVPVFNAVGQAGGGGREAGEKA
jgi:hypothetical protein